MIRGRGTLRALTAIPLLAAWGLGGLPARASSLMQDEGGGDANANQNAPTQAAPASRGQEKAPAVKPLSIGNGVSAPIPTYFPEPPYSEEARREGYEGTVVLWIVVDAEGKVSNVFVVKPLGLGLDEQAVKTVKTWQFRPAVRDSRAVPVQVSVEVTFRLLPPGLAFFVPGKDGVPPQPVDTPEPGYTEQARQAKVEGKVMMAVWVDTKGRVTKVQVIGPKLGMGLDKGAVKTVRKWRYRPATRNGEPVPAVIEVEVPFHPQST
jgi:TonB family protein